MRWYNIPIFDDLHNYFPDILYNPDRFTDVRDLTRYISESVRTRFNPSFFESAATASSSQMIMARTAHLLGQQYAAPTPRAVAAGTPRRYYGDNNYINNMMRARAGGLSGVSFGAHIVDPPESIETTIQNANRTYTSLVGLLDVLSARVAPAAATAYEPVRVAPTPAVISAATRIITVADTTIDNNCAICTDAIVAGNECRRINHCHHLFHRECIDRHFENSVRCPLCRHDIRESADAPAAAPAAAAPPADAPVPAFATPAHTDEEILYFISELD